MTFTVCILEPCCEKTEPGYQPRSRPVHVRTPGWSDTCNHRRSERRKATITTHETQRLAEAWFNGRARGWYLTDGWIFEGEMPPEGEGFRIMPIGGSLTTHYFHGGPVEIPFPTIELAREYAEDWHEYPDGNRHKQILFNIVGDQDTRVRWSSYGVPVGVDREIGEYA